MIARPGLRFAHRLALELGRVDVDAMLSEITATAFVRWEVYSRLEPFGAIGEDIRTARVCATVANASIKFKDTDFSPADFMPPPPKPPEPDLGELGGAIVAAFKAAGAQVIHADDR